MSDATPEAPAPAPEAAPEAAPAVEAPPAEPVVAPSQDGGDAAGFDINELPPAAQEYIRSLREENKTRRLEHDPFKKAFGHFNQAEQEYLINMVDGLGVDQNAGAQAMLDLSQRLLGIEAKGEEIASDPEAIEDAAKAGMSEEQYREMVRQEIQNEQMIASVEAETRSVGFEPGTKEATQLWDLALALDEPDLSVVAPILRQRLGLPEPENAEAQPAPEPEPVVETPSAEFPVNAAATGGTGDTNAEERPAPPAIASDEMRERVRRRIMAEAGQ